MIMVLPLCAEKSLIHNVRLYILASGLVAKLLKHAIKKEKEKKSIKTKEKISPKKHYKELPRVLCGQVMLHFSLNLSQ